MDVLKLPAVYNRGERRGERKLFVRKRKDCLTVVLATIIKVGKFASMSPTYEVSVYLWSHFKLNHKTERKGRAEKLVRKRESFACLCGSLEPPGLLHTTVKR